jgi:hypothetical protein
MRARPSGMHATCILIMMTHTSPCSMSCLPRHVLHDALIARIEVCILPRNFLLVSPWPRSLNAWVCNRVHTVIHLDDCECMAAHPVHRACLSLPCTHVNSQTLLCHLLIISLIMAVTSSAVRQAYWPAVTRTHARTHTHTRTHTHAHTHTHTHAHTHTHTHTHTVRRRRPHAVGFVHQRCAAWRPSQPLLGRLR